MEETLNELLEQEAEKLTQAARYERNEARQRYHSGHYSRNLTTTSGDVTLHVPRLKVDGKDPSAAWSVMDELMETLRVVNPRAYDSVLRKINRL